MSRQSALSCRTLQWTSCLAWSRTCVITLCQGTHARRLHGARMHGAPKAVSPSIWQALDTHAKGLNGHYLPSASHLLKRHTSSSMMVPAARCMACAPPPAPCTGVMQAVAAAVAGVREPGLRQAPHWPGPAPRHQGSSRGRRGAAGAPGAGADTGGRAAEACPPPPPAFCAVVGAPASGTDTGGTGGRTAAHFMLKDGQPPPSLPSCVRSAHMAFNPSSSFLSPGHQRRWN